MPFNQARFGATRFGYYQPNLIIKVGSTTITSLVRLETLEIEWAMKQPTRATLTVRDGYNAMAAADADTDLVIVLGADQAGPCRLFRGQIVSVEQVQVASRQTVEYQIVALSDLARLDGAFITQQWESVSATTILQDVMTTASTFLGVTFTSLKVQSSLTTIDFFSAINERPSTIFNRLLVLVAGSRWNLEDRDLRFEITDTLTVPATLISTEMGFWDYIPTSDRRQMRTKIIVEGKSASALVAVDALSTSFPIDDPTVALSTARFGAEVLIGGTVTVAADLGAVPGYFTAGASAGATSITIFQAVGDPADGFWLKTAGDQYISWTTFSGGGPVYDLSGIPASGTGAIANDIAANETFTFADFYTAPSALAYDHSINETLVSRLEQDDVTAQSTQGTKAVLIQDGRLSGAGMTARANAELAMFKSPIKRLTYTTRDPRTRIGRTVTTSFAAPTSFSGTYTIRALRIYGFDQVGPLTAHHRTSFPYIDVTEAAPAGFIDAVDLLSGGDDSR